ncbi:MAG TPA: alkaline phosphatase family protein [Gaiellaceae bacterium]|nr:alkaline phosphatase family protein [Gaiellaceae bacterium]
MTPLLYVLVDAVRHDYVAHERTPFLASLGARRGLSRMRPLLGYSDSIRAAIFTGAYPDETGYWMEYCFRPERTPLAPYARLAPLDALPWDFGRRGAKFVLSQTAVRRTARRNGYRHLSLRHLPFRALDRFDWTLRGDMSEVGQLGVPSVFDRARAAGLPWAYLDASKLGARQLLRRLDELDPTTAFTFVYLHQVDMASHLFGLESRLFERTLRRTDALAQAVVERVTSRIPGVEVAVFSDHGMSPVKRIAAYPSLWRHPAFPERFCFALDATMVRLWFHDAPPPLRDEVRETVAAGAPGRFLANDELAELHLDFDHRLYGDEIYLLEPRTAIFPNFHSLLKPKAMHAYHPDDPEQHGIAIGLPATAGVTNLVDLAPHAARTLGLERQPLALAG